MKNSDILDGLDLDTLEGIREGKQRLKDLAKTSVKTSLPDALDRELDSNESELSKLVQTHKLLDELEGIIRTEERPQVQTATWEDIADNIEPRKWLVDNLIPAHTATLLTGQGGKGKSWLSIQLACQVVLGYDQNKPKPFLNPEFNHETVYTPHNVVFATYEDEPEEIARRLHTIAGLNIYGTKPADNDDDGSFTWVRHHLKTVKDHLHVVDMRGIGCLWGPGEGKHVQVTGELQGAGEDLMALCEDKEAKLLIIDPLSGAFGGNENDRTAAYSFTSIFRKWADETGCGIVMVGHLPKDEKSKQQGYSGSTAWEAAFRSLILLEKKTYNEDNKTSDANREKEKATGARQKGASTRSDKATEGEKRTYESLQCIKKNYGPPHPTIPLIKTGQGFWAQAETRDEAAGIYESNLEYWEGVHTNVVQQEEENHGDFF